MKHVWLLLWMTLALWRVAQAEPHVLVEHASSFETLAVQAAQEWASTQNRRAHIEVMGSWAGAADALPGRYTLSRQVKAASAHARVMTVRFIREGGGASAASSGPEVRLRLRELTPAWVLVKPLQAGQALSCEVIEQQPQAVGPSSVNRWEGACDELTGRQARRPLGQGDVLLASDVRLPPAVSRLSTVVLRSVQGPIQIETLALALHDADVGQSVPVRPGGARQVVSAQVVAPGTVVLK